MTIQEHVAVLKQRHAFCASQEKDAACQVLLANRLRGTGCHLVKDIFARFTEVQHVPDPSQICMGMTPDALSSMTAAETVPCCIHGSWCNVAPDGMLVDIDISGSPCQLE